MCKLKKDAARNVDSVLFVYRRSLADKVSSPTVKVVVVLLHNVFHKGNAEHRVCGDPCKGICHAQAVDCCLRRFCAHRAARKRRRQQQTDRHARHKLSRARAQHELRLSDPLHTVA